MNNWEANLEFNFGKEIPVDFTGLIAKLEGIKTVIFVGGLSTLLEGEEMPVNYPGFKGGDRTDIELPAVQRNCLKALKEAGKTVVFVNNSGSAIGLVPETQTCDAILQSWYGGESGGQAVADVLFGDYNPSGKLPVTFYRDTTQLADFEDYAMDGRTYRYMKEDPLFKFGFGLSYTTFEIGEAAIPKTEITKSQSLKFTVPVKNTGDRSGTEILQVYLRKVDDADGPIKTLKQFKRVELKPGEQQQVALEIVPESFQFYSEEKLEMAAEPGEYQIFYGNSSDEANLKTFIINLKPQI